MTYAMIEEVVRREFPRQHSDLPELLEDAALTGPNGNFEPHPCCFELWAFDFEISNELNTHLPAGQDISFS